MRAGLIHIFGEDLAAIWLYGAPLFGPSFVDIDMHVLLTRSPTPERGRQIRRLHERIERDLPDWNELDIWYVLLDAARLPEPPANVGPWNPGFRDNHWSLHRAHWLAGACVVVYGLLPQEVVVSPTWEELKETLRLEADEAGHRLDGGSPYWTLQLCRVLASLETRDVVRSKLDSGQWALQRLALEAHAIIEAAMRFYARTAEASDPELIATAFPGFYRLVRALIDAAFESA